MGDEHKVCVFVLIHDWPSNVQLIQSISSLCKHGLDVSGRFDSSACMACSQLACNRGKYVLQAKGNAAFAAGDFEAAIEHFSAGIAEAPESHVLYSNRSACKVSARHWHGIFHVAEPVCTRVRCVSQTP